MRLFEGTEFYQPPRCEKCDKLEEFCECPPPEPPTLPPEKQTATIRVEKRKKGKVVTVVRGLAKGSSNQLLTGLLKHLKNSCGAGGTIQDNAIEIQGDHLDRVVNLLKEFGYRVRT